MLTRLCNPVLCTQKLLTQIQRLTWWYQIFAVENLTPMSIHWSWWLNTIWLLYFLCKRLERMVRNVNITQYWTSFSTAQRGKGCSMFQICCYHCELAQTITETNLVAQINVNTKRKCLDFDKKGKIIRISQPELTLWQSWRQNEI